MDNVRYYSLDADLNVCQHDITTKPQAMIIIDKYISQQKDNYEICKEALADSMFGFSIDDKTFIELYIDTKDDFRIKFEIPTIKKLGFIKLPGLFQKEISTNDKEHLKEITGKFFDLSIGPVQGLLPNPLTKCSTINRRSTHKQTDPERQNNNPCNLCNPWLKKIITPLCSLRYYRVPWAPLWQKN